MPERYVGRFAPSPTGPLHFGSLVTAVGSWLDARAAGGRWLLRIEDIDEPRTVPGAADSIQRTLEAFGLAWDGPVVWQTHRHAYYRDAMATLGHRAFPCACSRKEVREPYPGTCRQGVPAGRGGRAFRLLVTDELIQFDDRRFGPQHERLTETCGDFVLLRADGLFAYQLAVVVDDALQGVTDVVRGEDLLDSTARQLWLQRQLGYPTPRYLHLPLAVTPTGEKLSKQTAAPPVQVGAEVLWRVLRHLHQDPPTDLRQSPCAEILNWAVAHWQPARLRTALAPG